MVPSDDCWEGSSFIRCMAHSDLGEVCVCVLEIWIPEPAHDEVWNRTPCAILVCIKEKRYETMMYVTSVLGSITRVTLLWWQKKPKWNYIRWVHRQLTLVPSPWSSWLRSVLGVHAHCMCVGYTTVCGQLAIERFILKTSSLGSGCQVMAVHFCSVHRVTWLSACVIMSFYQCESVCVWGCECMFIWYTE